MGGKIWVWDAVDDRMIDTTLSTFRIPISFVLGGTALGFIGLDSGSIARD